MKSKQPIFSTLLFSFLLALTAESAHAASALDLEMHGYLRTGARTSECFNNKGPAAGINEFRLGNECGSYGEANFVAWQLRPSNAKDAFFKTNITLNFATPEVTHVEPMSPGLFEAYIDSGNFFQSTVKYWVGKRVYRDAAVHMNDDFYFANINGNGAGIYDIGLPTGKLALAYFLEQGNPVGLASDSGHRVRSHMIDLRWQDIELAEKQKLDFWGAYATTRGGSAYDSATTLQDYDATSGFALGLKHKYVFNDGSLNALSAQYGSKLLQGLNLPSIILAETINPAAPSRVSDRNRLRLVEDLVYQVTDRASLEFAARYEHFNGTLSTEKGNWWNVGTRPAFFFNDHFGVQTEMGVSSVKFESDTDASILKRLTVAPTLALNSKYFGRPQLRTYYTTSFNRGNAFGVQGEVWF